MYEFLEKNMVSFNKHFNGSDSMYFCTRTGSKGINSISYTGGINSTLLIGFDYNTSGGERTNMFEIMKWMTQKIGKKPNVYYYDGEPCEIIGLRTSIDKEIFDRKKDNETMEDVTIRTYSYNLGIINTKYKKTGKPFPNDFIEDGKKSNSDLDKEIEEKMSFIEGDIKRLDSLWNDSIYFEVK